MITGASKGLGKQLALECARRKMNLILVSLPNENLEGLSMEIASSYQIHVSYREIDLTVRSSVEDLARWVNEDFAVSMVINNAGIGGSHIFTDCTTDYLDSIIQLNINAMVLLTRLLLPQLKMRQNAYILNVSSLAAFSPIPYKTVYPASKVFIHNFSLGLKAELKDTNVSVSVLSPGPMLTNSDVSKRINGQSLYVKRSILAADKIAPIAIKKLLKGRAVIIPGFINKFTAFMIRMVPVSVRIHVGTNIFKRELKKKQTKQVDESTYYRSNGTLRQQPDQPALKRKI